MPVELVKCRETATGKECGLVQLRYSAELESMYGEGYGYRSGLNASMSRHLKQIVERVEARVPLQALDLVIDIGSNDATTLKHYQTPGLALTGVDPTGPYFKRYYPAHINLIPEFFTAGSVRALHGEKKAKVVTSIAMFYDLPEPLTFVKHIHEVLEPGGVWVFEQSYLATMLERNSYDTVCHEHLEYYGLRQVKWMTDIAGFDIVHVELTEANGGSFLVMAQKRLSTDTTPKPLPALATELLAKEIELGLNTLKPYQDFAKRTESHRQEIKNFFAKARSENKRVLGYGASTKGNVLLQYCGITPKEMPVIADVNEDKFNRFTPGTHIPICSEADARSQDPDYFFVLPWHFRESILRRESDTIASGVKFVFPLPTFQIV